MMAIHSVAAGGGSILCYDGARFSAFGPESGRRGSWTGLLPARRPIDRHRCQCVCGCKIQPRHFPAIFGPAGDLPIDDAVVRERFAALAVQAQTAGAMALDSRATAAGFLRVAVSHMANAIKQVSLEKGHDVTEFALQCFGGAGGQHACLVAEELWHGQNTDPPAGWVLSAYGMGLADQSLQRERAIERALNRP